MNLKWSSLDRWSDFGLLILRAGLGALFAFVHGYPKLAAGADAWRSAGRAVGYLGIDFAHTAWGFAAVVSLTLGGVLLILGWAHRPAALILSITMIVATIWQYYPFGGWSAAAYPASMCVACIALFFTGPGKFSLDART